MSERKTLTLLPPAPGACPACATVHPPEDPHHQQSLYYQMAFKLREGRFPRWSDALAHCSPEIKAAWTTALKDEGAWDGGD